MKRLLMIGLMALAGTIGCDADSDGDGTGSDGSTSEGSTSETQGTATTPTTSPPTTTTETSGQTTSATSGTTSDGTTSEGTSDGTTSDGTTSEGESSSTGEPMTVTPCQPEMSRQQIDAWRGGAANRMPTFGDIAQPLEDFDSSASVGGFTNQPNPMGGGFIMDPDGGGVSVECSLWDQDCPEGEKCNAWANDGGSSWNAARCVPIAPDPVGVGEACTVEGSGVSGIDDCELGAMCWDVDAETNEGTCVALCDGPPNDPTCAPEATACSISNEGVLILCLPICNPLADECADGQGCFPVGEFFQCAPVAGGGEPGDPCEFVNACDDGGACVNPGIVPGCPGGAAGCCTAYCNLEGDGSECLDDQECLPWYEMGQEPDVCLEGVGICSSPG